MAITAAQQDRALGAILASTAGDALGAPYEFQFAVLPPTPIEPKAGGVWELGEWTDDTAMAMPILRALAEGRSLEDEATLDGIVEEWFDWAHGAKDVGVQTMAIMRAMRWAGTVDAAGARRASWHQHQETGRTAGNGSLMRTGPVALGSLGDPGRAARAARVISDLTHFDDDAGDASALWTAAIAHAIETGELALEQGIAQLSLDRQQRWRDLAVEAEARMPWQLAAERSNGWVIGAFQCAWSAIMHGDSLEDVLVLAVRSGDDTDTVAAIAGSLAGAVQGASALPEQLTAHLHGWLAEGVVGTGSDLAALNRRALSRDEQRG